MSLLTHSVVHIYRFRTGPMNSIPDIVLSFHQIYSYWHTLSHSLFLLIHITKYFHICHFHVDIGTYVTTATYTLSSSDSNIAFCCIKILLFTSVSSPFLTPLPDVYVCVYETRVVCVYDIYTHTQTHFT